MYVYFPTTYKQCANFILKDLCPGRRGYFISKGMVIGPFNYVGQNGYLGNLI